MRQPLSLQIEQARQKLNAAFNEIIADSGLPAYLLEVALLDILASIRNQKSLEMLTDFRIMNNQSATDKKKEGEEIR